MPQDIDFDIRIPSWTSPERSAARERNLLWARRMRLPHLAQEATIRYVDVICAYLRGIYDWHRVAVRYACEVSGEASPDTTGCLDVSDLAAAVPTRPPEAAR
ncbi:hypothetical protein J2X68_001171 [Streptomyces sp. 3330]|uniref:hypothetical protein n=1 Tax=Streptomyces sp. 3330 TaxID=2817755 RepID=UPI0028677894|nr:hypothetical protein [Streptomyces sp. 3330]MDR6974493.1 hypothetical protein [Streptomyces sp. 3330]